MSPLQEISITIGIIGTICSIIFALLAFGRNSKKDNTSDGKQSGAMLAELGYIKAGIDDIKRKQELQEQQHIEVISRLTVVEESTKQAHKRLDTYEKK